MKSLPLLLLILALSLPILAQPSMEAAGRALQLEDAGKLKEAAEVWREAAREFAKEGDLNKEGRAWFYRAGNLFDTKQHRLALEALKEAYRCFSGLESAEGRGLVRLQEGIVYDALQDWVKAEAALRESVTLFRQAGKFERALQPLELLSAVLQAARRWPEATAVTLELREAYANSPKKLPELVSTLAALYQLQGEQKRAEQHYREAIAMLVAQDRNSEALAERARMARFLLQNRRFEEAAELLGELRLAYQGQPKAEQLATDQAYALMQLGQYTEALNLTNTLLETTTQSKLRSILTARKLEILSLLGRQQEALAILESPDFGSDYQRAQSAESLGRRDLAEGYFRRALEQAEPSKKPAFANSLAVRLMHWDRPEEAGEILEAALALPASQEPSTKATLTLNLGESFLKRGLPHEALPHFEESAVWFEKNGDIEDAATALNNLGATWEALGEYRKALATLEKAQEIGLRFQKPSRIQGSIANATGVVYVKLGRPEVAIRHYRNALALHQRFANAEGEIASWINLGAAYEIQNKRSKAFEAYDKALDLARKEGRVALQATLYNNLGQAASDPAVARRLYGKALELDSGDNIFRPIVLSNMARNAVDRSDFSEAQSLATQAAEQLQATGSRKAELGSREVLLELALKAREFPECDRQLVRMLELTEEIVEGLSSRSARSFVGKNEKLFREALGLLLERQDWPRIFALEEKLRSLGLAALTRGIDLSSAHIPESLSQRRKTLLSQIRYRRNQPYSSTSGQILKSLNEEYRLLLDQVERHHYAASALHKLHSADLSEVQQALQPGEVLCEYLSSGQQLHLLVVSREGVSYRQLGERAAVESSLRRTLRAIRRRAKPSVCEAALEELGEQVLPSDTLEGVEKIVIIPSGELFSVPFPALFKGGTPLFERYQMSTASSASAWLVSRRARPQGKGALLTALGNWVPHWVTSSPSAATRSNLAPLPSTLRELESLLSLLPSSESLLEAQMTEQAIRTGSRGKRMIHLATHGVLDQAEPMFSGLVAADRLVTAAEIFQWKLDAELAVLSACHSGQLSVGQEYVSLTSAFQFAGARTLLVSLWAVSDEATADWMKSFYGALEQGETAAQALRQAHRSLRQQEPHPFYWAPFTLWGDGMVSPL